MIFGIEIRGVVHGVGLRPFIYNLASSSRLRGEVSNNGQGVLILLDCSEDRADEFVKKIRDNKLPLCEIDSIKITKVKKQNRLIALA
ncbi:MAG: acylphosphatase [Sulfurimonas sp.]